MDSVRAILCLERSEAETAAGLVQAQATAGRIRDLQGQILEVLSGFEQTTSAPVVSPTDTTAPVPILEPAETVGPDEEFPADDFADFDEAINDDESEKDEVL